MAYAALAAVVVAAVVVPAAGAVPAAAFGPSSVEHGDRLGAGRRVGAPLLVPYESVLRSLPPVGGSHRFRAATVHRTWSVIGLWPGTTGDVDLEVFDDRRRQRLLAASEVGLLLTDFVAIDSSARRLGTDHVRVSTVAGTGSYLVEQAAGDDVLGDEPVAVWMSNESLVAVRDTALVAGVTYTFTMSATPYGEGDIFLVGSDPADPSSRAQSRLESLAESSGAPRGKTETFTFTPARTDVYGLVLVNERGHATYTLTRSR